MRKIAMRCTQEQFDDIKEELKNNNIKIKTDYQEIVKLEYLTNDYETKPLNVGFCGHWNKKYNCRETYEQWDKNIFLEACGIEPKYKITKETIFKYKMKDEFPEMFEVKLEVGKIYSYFDCVLCFQGIKNNLIQAYGFYEDKTWMDLCNCGNSPKEWKEYNPKIFEAALINEAKKRGFKEGVYFIEPKNVFCYNTKNRLAKGVIEMYGENSLCFSHTPSLIFKDGFWAEIIKTINKEEAEKKLGVKIVN